MTFSREGYHGLREPANNFRCCCCCCSCHGVVVVFLGRKFWDILTFLLYWSETHLAAAFTCCCCCGFCCFFTVRLQLCFRAVSTSHETKTSPLDTIYCSSVFETFLPRFFFLSLNGWPSSGATSVAHYLGEKQPIFMEKSVCNKYLNFFSVWIGKNTGRG